MSGRICANDPDKLTVEQELFCSLRCKGRNQSDAYREAVPKSAKWKPETIWVRASEWSSMRKVQVRIEQIHDELKAKGVWTREDSARTLVEVIESPDKKSDIIAAVKVLNEMHGYNAPKQVEHGGDALTQLFAARGGRVWGVVANPERPADKGGE